MPPKPTFWGPYANEGEARQCLGAFAAEIVGPGAGVIFCDGRGAEFLRTPFYDADGSGLVLIATCHAELAPAPPAPPPHGTWQKIEKIFNDAMADYGRQQIEYGNQQRAMGEAELAAIKKGWTSLHDFVEGHKTEADGLAVVGDVFGVMAGVVAAVAIVTGGIAVLPVLGVVAGVASLALLAEDGRMLYADVKGDEVRKKEIEDSTDYKVIELVGPLLLLPDLIFGGPRAAASLPKSAKELAETTEELSHGQEVLNAQREATDAYKEAQAGKLKKANIQTKLQRMRARANKLARDVKAAQQRLAAAQKEFVALRAIEMPAYAGSIYASGLYMVEPPDCLKELAQCAPHHPAPLNPQNPGGHGEAEHNPMRLLVPPHNGAHRPPASAATQLNFQVAIGQNPAIKR